MAKTFAEYWDEIKSIECQDDEMIFYRGVADKSFGFILAASLKIK